MKRKIGIMGGTFDPIHIGHLLLAESAYEQFDLEKVWFMPAGNPPHKKIRSGCASNEQRVEMVRRAIDDNEHFELCMHEMEKGGYSYTYLTLEALNRTYPDIDFYFIIGADSLFDLSDWKFPERICAACTLLVATRNHASYQLLEARIDECEQLYHGTFLRMNTLNIDISSNTLREWICEGKSVKYYVSDQVIDYIEKQKMYLEVDELNNYDIK